MTITIIKKGVGTAIRREEEKREVHDPYSVEYYKDRYESAAHVLSGGEVASADGTGTYKPLKKLQAPEDLRYHMNRAQKNYLRGCPITLDAGTRNALWKKLKLIKDRVTPGMVPRSEMHPVKIKQVGGQIKTVVDYGKLSRSRAVDRNDEWEKRNAKDLREAKRILRVLEPKDKKITQITETWRPEGG